MSEKRLSYATLNEKDLTQKDLQKVWKNLMRDFHEPIQEIYFFNSQCNWMLQKYTLTLCFRCKNFWKQFYKYPVWWLFQRNGYTVKIKFPPLSFYPNITKVVSVTFWLSSNSCNPAMGARHRQLDRISICAQRCIFAQREQVKL